MWDNTLLCVELDDYTVELDMMHPYAHKTPHLQSSGSGGRGLCLRGTSAHLNTLWTHIHTFHIAGSSLQGDAQDFDKTKRGRGEVSTPRRHSHMYTPDSDLQWELELHLESCDHSHHNLDRWDSRYWVEGLQGFYMGCDIAPFHSEHDPRDSSRLHRDSLPVSTWHCDHIGCQNGHSLGISGSSPRVQSPFVCSPVKGRAEESIPCFHPYMYKSDSHLKW